MTRGGRRGDEMAGEGRKEEADRRKRRDERERCSVRR